MSDHDAVPEADCPWESGALGLSEEHALASTGDHEQSVDDALGLQLISIRLPKGLIADLKFIATREGLGYQPLVRRVLQRFAAWEFKNMAHENLSNSGGVALAELGEECAEEPKARRRA